MTRRFARLRPGSAPFPPGFFGVPSDGMCLNVFLIVRAPTDSGRVLVGRPSSDPRWYDVGALDPPRIERIGERWMLPSSQLLLLEGPEEAVRRVALEQLGLELTSLPTVQIVSETYPRRGPPEADPHWDMHFIYGLEGPSTPPSTPLWTDLAYLPVNETPRSRFGRDHADILERVGLHPLGEIAVDSLDRR